MKKIILLVFALVCYLQVNAQKQPLSKPSESNLSISYAVTTLSDGYDWGASLGVHSDFNGPEGFGYIAKLTYLSPNSAISDFIDYALTFDILLKYDFIVADKLELAPTAGLGYIKASGDVDSEADYYFAAGATASYFISNSTIIGVDITKPFLEGANTSVALSVRFQI